MLVTLLICGVKAASLQHHWVSVSGVSTDLHDEITFVVEWPRSVWFYSFQNLKPMHSSSNHAFLAITESFWRRLVLSWTDTAS